MLLQVCLIAAIPMFLVLLLIKLGSRIHWEWVQSLLSRIDDIFLQNRGRRKPFAEGGIMLVIFIVPFLVWRYSKPAAWWQDGRIMVMADSTDWGAVQGVLKSTFERTMRTPQPEKIYSISCISSEEISTKFLYQYIVVLATLESEGSVREIVNDKILSDPEKHQLFKEGECVFPFRNLWGRNQLVVFLVGNNIQALKESIIRNNNSLYDLFDNHVHGTVRAGLLTSKEQEKQTDSMLASYGWALEKMADLEITFKDTSENFIVFGPWTPGRWICVNWIENGNMDCLNPDWVVRKRNRIGNYYLDGVYVEERFFQSDRSTFLGRPAQISSGLWGDDDPVMGGPFTNYTFYDSLSQRIYMIDVFVFAAGKDKIPLMRRLQVQAHSFITREDRKS